MSPLLYQLSYRAGEATLPRPARPSGSLRSNEMLIFSINQALGQTLALAATFLGIGVLVNLLIAYVVAQVFGEHKENKEGEPPAV
jgi:hypothetical protein